VTRWRRKDGARTWSNGRSLYWTVAQHALRLSLPIWSKVTQAKAKIGKIEGIGRFGDCIDRSSP
jgi:hypothetical protein